MEWVNGTERNEEGRINGMQKRRGKKIGKENNEDEENEWLTVEGKLLNRK